MDLSLTRPNGAAATDELSRGHRHPLASPMRSKAPPRPPLPPHRSTALRKPCITAIAVVFYLGPAGHLRQIRRLRTVPDLAERPLVIAVSH